MAHTHRLYVDGMLAHFVTDDGRGFVLDNGRRFSYGRTIDGRETSKAAAEYALLRAFGYGAELVEL